MTTDALLVVSFGGPEGPADVIPFLRNVVRGRDVPDERLAVVAEQYMAVGGRSPINDQNRALIAALRPALDRRGMARPVYWGNRNWAPYLGDTVAAMRDDGVRRAAVFVTSAYSSYSGCRQYLEDLEAARAGAGAGAPELLRVRPFFNHPGFVGPLADGLRAARAEAGPEAAVLAAAHSIPLAMARTCDYERQLAETARLVAAEAGEAGPLRQVFQSRSGPPSVPWLEPDVNDAISSLDPASGAVIVVPTGFVSDHMEVLFDLDTRAAATAARCGMRLVRSPTPGLDPRFVDMICDLVDEIDRPGDAPVRTVGSLGAAPRPCRAGCCPPPSHRPGRPVDSAP